MKKKVLVPLVMICILAVSTLIISYGPSKSVEVNANSDMLKTLDNSDRHVIYLWVDKETGKEYILYHNTFYNEFSICPR